MILASVQSAQDASVPPALVLVVVLTFCIVIAAWAVPAIVRAWRRSHPRPHDPATCDCKATR